MSTKPKTRKAPAKPSTVASPLLGLIDTYRAAYDAFIEAINRLNEAENAATRRRWNKTCNAEDDALTAIWAHSCETPEDTQIKVEYLLSMPHFLDDAQKHHVEALLLSFLPQTNDEAA
jgi:hypothetical protein